MGERFDMNANVPGVHTADNAAKAEHWAARVGREPLVLVSRRRGRMDPPSPLLLATTLNGLAPIIILDNQEACDAFAGRAGERYATYGSVVRAIARDGDTWYWPANARTPSGIARAVTAWLRARRGPRTATDADHTVGAAVLRQVRACRLSVGKFTR